MHAVPIQISQERLSDFCRRWKVAELSLFGSVLRDDFAPDSDIDVLVTFVPGADVSLWEVLDMEEELSAIFGRKVDLVEKKGVVNPFVRHRILTTRQVIYAA